MSNAVNDDLLELASEHINYWTGTPMARMLEADLEREDLETLEVHLKESAQTMFDQEFRPDGDQ